VAAARHELTQILGDRRPWRRVEQPRGGERVVRREGHLNQARERNAWGGGGVAGSVVPGLPPSTPYRTHQQELVRRPSQERRNCEERNCACPRIRTPKTMCSNRGVEPKSFQRSRGVELKAFDGMDVSSLIANTHPSWRGRFQCGTPCVCRASTAPPPAWHRNRGSRSRGRAAALWTERKWGGAVDVPRFPRLTRRLFLLLPLLLRPLFASFTHAQRCRT
jgi:hypothetical protein